MVSIMSLAMLSPTISRGDAADICFQCFDQDGSGALTKDEVAKMVKEGLTTFITLEVMDTIPPDEKIEAFINAMMAGSGNGTSIPKQTYIEA